MNDQPLTPVATRIALVLRSDLTPWQSVNVAAFLASGITESALKGEDYADADGTTYLPLLAQPVMIHEGDVDELAAVRARAVDRGLRVAVYERGMFETGDDAANRAVVAAKPGAQLDLVGVALHGPRNVVSRILKGVAKHR